MDHTASSSTSNTPSPSSTGASTKPMYVETANSSNAQETIRIPTPTTSTLMKSDDKSKVEVGQTGLMAAVGTGKLATGFSIPSNGFGISPASSSATTAEKGGNENKAEVVAGRRVASAAVGQRPQTPQTTASLGDSKTQPISRVPSMAPSTPSLVSPAEKSAPARSTPSVDPSNITPSSAFSSRNFGLAAPLSTANTTIATETQTVASMAPNSASTSSRAATVTSDITESVKPNPEPATPKENPAVTKNATPLLESRGGHEEHLPVAREASPTAPLDIGGVPNTPLVSLAQNGMERFEATTSSRQNQAEHVPPSSRPPVSSRALEPEPEVTYRETENTTRPVYDPRMTATVSDDDEYEFTAYHGSVGPHSVHPSHFEHTRQSVITDDVNSLSGNHLFGVQSNNQQNRDFSNSRSVQPPTAAYRHVPTGYQNTDDYSTVRAHPDNLRIIAHTQTPREKAPSRDFATGNGHAFYTISSAAPSGGLVEENYQEASRKDPAYRPISAAEGDGDYERHQDHDRLHNPAQNPSTYRPDFQRYPARSPVVSGDGYGERYRHHEYDTSAFDKAAQNHRVHETNMSSIATSSIPRAETMDTSHTTTPRRAPTVANEHTQTLLARTVPTFTTTIHGANKMRSVVTTQPPPAVSSSSSAPLASPSPSRSPLESWEVVQSTPSNFSHRTEAKTAVPPTPKPSWWQRAMNVATLTDEECQSDVKKLVEESVDSDEQVQKLTVSLEEATADCKILDNIWEAAQSDAAGFSEDVKRGLMANQERLRHKHRALREQLIDRRAKVADHARATVDEKMLKHKRAYNAYVRMIRLHPLVDQAHSLRDEDAKSSLFVAMLKQSADDLLILKALVNDMNATWEDVRPGEIERMEFLMQDLQSRVASSDDRLFE